MGQRKTTPINCTADTGGLRSNIPPNVECVLICLHVGCFPFLARIDRGVGETDATLLHFNLPKNTLTTDRFYRIIRLHAFIFRQLSPSDWHLCVHLLHDFDGSRPNSLSVLSEFSLSSLWLFHLNAFPVIITTHAVLPASRAGLVNRSHELHIAHTF